MYVEKTRLTDEEENDDGDYTPSINGPVRTRYLVSRCSSSPSEGRPSFFGHRR